MFRNVKFISITSIALIGLSAGPAMADAKSSAADACPRSRLCFYSDTDFEGRSLFVTSAPTGTCWNTSGDGFPYRSIINNTNYRHRAWRGGSCDGESWIIGPHDSVDDLGFDAHSTSRD